MKKLFFIFLILFSCFLSQAQELKYLRYDKDLISKEEFKDRRDSLMKMMKKESIGIFYSGPERQRNGDVNFLYHQDENFHYLTGFDEPNSILILIPYGFTVPSMEDSSKKQLIHEILFVPKRIKEREQWTGRTFGPDGAVKLSGLEYALTNDQFANFIYRLIRAEKTQTLYFSPIPEDINLSMKDLLNPLRNYLAQIDSYHYRKEIIDPRPYLFQLRSIKSAQEIALIRKASEISAIAHQEAMKSLEPGFYEYQIQAVYEYVFTHFGAEYTGYPCIVGSNENSVILHYESNRKQIQGGELLLADCAAEYHNYSSDVTRTYPSNGHFSLAQKEIYNIVLKAQKECISMVKAGTSWKNVQLKSEEIITDGLFQLGIIKEKTYAQMRRFYMHGVGHPVGLNVHDVGINPLDLPENRILKSGMIYTVEPGIYIGEGQEGVDPKYFNIGVRIEDCVLVTPNGCDVLSAKAPREINEIEALMKKKGIGNYPFN